MAQAVELERCSTRSCCGVSPISRRCVCSGFVPGSAFVSRNQRRGWEATEAATTPSRRRRLRAALGICLALCWTGPHATAAADPGGANMIVSCSKSRRKMAFLPPPSIRRLVPIDGKRGQSRAPPWACNTRMTTSVPPRMSTTDTTASHRRSVTDDDSSSSRGDYGVGNRGGAAGAVTTYLDSLSSGRATSGVVPSDGSVSSSGGVGPSNREEGEVGATTPSAEAIASYLESLSLAPSTETGASEDRIDGEEEAWSGTYLDVLARECDADAPSQSPGDDCAAAIKSYLDAISVGRSSPSARAASILASYLEGLSGRRGAGAAVSTSATVEEAVASYLDAVSSRIVPSPSGMAISSYLDAISTGEVPTPKSAEAVASFLDAVWALRGRTVDGSWTSLTITSRCHLEAIARACDADNPEGSEGCREAVEGYARAIATGEVRPSLEVDDDEEGCPIVGPAAGVDDGGRRTRSVAAATDPVRFGTTAAAEFSSSPSPPDASTPERRPQQQHLPDGNCCPRGRTLYDVLRVSPDATREELKKQYVALARLSHPDAVNGARKGVASARSELRSTPISSVDPSSSGATTGNPPDFVEIAAAYKILSDPKRRRRYDRSLWAESFTTDVERAAENIGRVAGPRVVRLFERVALPLIEKTAATSAAAILAVANATPAKKTSEGGDGDGDGASGGIQRNECS